MRLPKKDFVIKLFFERTRGWQSYSGFRNIRGWQLAKSVDGKVDLKKGPS